MTQILPPELAGAAVELAPYFCDSWGNATRIDYGTGHETTFVAIGLLKEVDFEATVFRVFNTCVSARSRCTLSTQLGSITHLSKRAVISTSCGGY